MFDSVQGALYPPASGRFFSAIRPGDLVWVMEPSYTSERPTEDTAAAVEKADPPTPHNSTDQCCLKALTEIAESIAVCASPPNAGAIAAIDSGFRINSASSSPLKVASVMDSNRGRNGEVHSIFDPDAHLFRRCKPSSRTCLTQEGPRTGLWRREFSNEYLSEKMTLTVSIFEMAGSQIIYMHIPGSGYAVRQQVLPNPMLQIDHLSLRTQQTVLETVASAYHTIKSQLMVWAANTLLLCEGRQQQCGLLALPMEALANAFSNLSYGDIATLASVSRRLKRVTAERSIWERLLQTEFFLTPTAGQV